MRVGLSVLRDHKKELQNQIKALDTPFLQRMCLCHDQAQEEDKDDTPDETPTEDEMVCRAFDNDHLATRESADLCP